MIIKEAIIFQKYWLNPAGTLIKCQDHNEYAVKNILKLSQEQIIDILTKAYGPDNYDEWSDNRRLEELGGINAIYRLANLKKWVRVSMNKMGGSQTGIFFDIGNENYVSFLNRHQLNALIDLSEDLDLPLIQDILMKKVHIPGQFTNESIYKKLARNL